MPAKTDRLETLTVRAPSIAGRIEQAIFDYVYNTFGRSEAIDPSWYTPDLAKAIAAALKNPDYTPEHKIRYETN